MLKKSTKFYFLFILIALFSSIAAWGQDYVTTEGVNIYAKLRADDLEAVFGNDLTNLERWIDHLDTCYDRLRELTSYAPYSGAKIGIESVDESPDVWWWAVMGNPILWNRAVIVDALSGINNDDDWCFSMIHEISHDFEHSHWDFHYEVLATFKALYILDSEPGFVPSVLRQELTTNFTNDYNGAIAAFNTNGIVRPSVEYWLIYIQSRIGWDPFKNAFAYMLQNGDPAASGAQKFMSFMNALDSFTPTNVIALIPADELSRIKHFLDKGELCKWDDGYRISLRAARNPSGDIRLSWDDAINTEDGYEIQYSVNGGSFQYLAEVGANTTQYVKTGLEPANTYRFRARSFSASSHISYRGYSYFSNEIDPDIASMFKPVTADGETPENAVDGAIQNVWSASGPEPHSLIVDLQDLVAIDKLVVKHAGVNGFPTYNTRDYRIQKSIDGQNWQDIISTTGNTQDTTTHILGNPVYASYIRLYITKATQTSDTTARIPELEVYRAKNPGPLANLALGKPATADAYLYNEEPDKAVDGSVEGSKWCSISGTDHYLQVDLGQTMNVSYFVVKHAGLMEPAEYNTRQFTIKASLTDSNWETIQPAVNVTDNESNITYHAVSLSTRYVRLDLIQASQSDDTTARIYELEAWGMAQPANGFQLLYKDADGVATNNTIHPCFKIVNNSGASVNLSEFKIRYWYTIDNALPQSFVCDYAAIGNWNVSGTFVSISPAKNGADYYMEVSFAQGAGQLANGSDSGQIQTRFNKTNWSDYNEVGDHSYDPSKTEYTSWNKVTLYRNGQLVWGIEPQ